jgi:predicted secreted protein
MAVMVAVNSPPSPLNKVMGSPGWARKTWTWRAVAAGKAKAKPVLKGVGQ